jgi:C4-type Zn-finger protein
MEDDTDERREVEGLCPECGRSFKVYIDRLISRGGAVPAEAQMVECPVCGCGNCRIGR